MVHGTRSAYVHGKCRCEECRDAERAYQQAYRLANIEGGRAYERRPERDSRLRDDPVKRKAREQAYDKLVRRKGQGKKPCERCGATVAQMHHDDYSKPLAVRWLCGRCHGIEHRKP
jgi:ribosomal protein S27AE